MFHLRAYKAWAHKTSYKVLNSNISFIANSNTGLDIGAKLYDICALILLRIYNFTYMYYFKYTILLKIFQKIYVN